jgi:hypothetical protein
VLTLVACRLCAGDHGVIAKETARQLGLGTNIPDAAGLPTLGADGKIPKDLGKKYGKMILEADGFAQVRPPSLTWTMCIAYHTHNCLLHHCCCIAPV